MHSSLVCRGRWAAAAVLLGIPSAVFAQDQQDPGQGGAGGQVAGQMMQMIMQAVPGLMKGMKEHPAPVVQVTPGTATVDAKTKTVTLEIVNPIQDSVEVELSVGNAAPVANGKDSAAAKPAGEPVAAGHSLAAWVTGVPKTVALGPGEKKAIPVQLNVPSGSAAGEYAAWVVATTVRYQFPLNASGPKGESKLGDDGPRPQAGAKVVYQTK